MKGGTNMLNYQIIIDFITQLMYIAAPIAIAFTIVDKITNIFLEFVGGKRVKL